MKNATIEDILSKISPQERLFKELEETNYKHSKIDWL